MTIDAYIFCWNEEELLPFTLDYYSEFCDSIILFDNFSTDSSVEIAKQYPKVKVISWGAEDIYDDRLLTLAKNTCYKDYGRGADWVIVADCDEFLYHPKIREKLYEYREAGITVPLTEGFDMISQKFPEIGSSILEQVKRGVPEEGMNKSLVFDPRVNLVYAVGAHSASTDQTYGLFRFNELMPPSTSYNPTTSESCELKVLHYTDLSPEYKMGRLKVLAPRLSKWSLENKQTDHWLQTEEEVLDHFDRALKVAEEVI
jgi:glycosyltransferase involved in cell wall biosynthesis|tara:strand:- start:1 stop:774 length:774 start_codon:yes stop_codon:yes gene_type:complete